MNKITFAVAFVFFVAIHAAFGQVNSSIGGTVTDQSGALIPGVSITALNTQTSVSSSTITNESGAYNFAALIAGKYKVTASLPGFRSQTFEDVPLSAGSPIRLNFKLEVGQVATDVNVTADASALLSQSSASIGEVLTGNRVTELPLVSNSVLDLIRILPGFRESPGGNAFDTFAGLPAETLNTTRDGVSVTDGRFANGLFSTTTINPDLVGEVRLILTPVDAELGRGNAQVQITTRSGTNRFTGSAVWNIQNSALDPNTWSNNRSIDNATGKAPQRNWTNNNEYSLSYGGPIIKGKTFFFALWEQQIHKERVLTDGGVLTDTARLGIMRYFDRWNPQRYGVPNTPFTSAPSSSARVYTAVDVFGNPVAPLHNPDGSPYSGAGLMCFSVFGTRRLDTNGAMVPFTQADCPGGTAIIPGGTGTAWDNNRPALDSTGYVLKAVLQAMPQANYFGDVTSALTPDGLNTATIRWMRRRGGNDDGNTTTGLGDHWDRKQINIKIDHNFSQNHKLSGTYTLERNYADSSQSAWPNGYGGDIVRNPHVLSANFTSTLGPSLVNEARFGLRYNKTDGRGAFENDNRDSLNDILNYFSGGPDPGITRTAGGTYPVLVGASGAGNAISSFNFFSGTAGLFTLASSHNGNRSILYTYADTLSWTKGKHAFKFGGEYRPTTSRGYSNIPNLPTPRVYTGAGNTLSPVASGGVSIGNSDPLATLRNNAASLLYLLSGSINQVEMVYWLDSYQDVQDRKWQSILTRPDIFRTIIINEASGFVKDDWKIRNNLTLNVGLRWEYYGSPYIEEGFTGAPRDLGVGVFGTGRSSNDNVWGSWLRPGVDPVFLSGYGTGASAANALQCTTGLAQANLPTSSCNPDSLTQIDFIGPNSPNPDRVAVPIDRNNFGPAIGFSYQVPWFSRMTIRGGYQMTFGSAGRNTSTIGGGTQQVIGSIPGATSNITGSAALAGQFPTQYLDLTSLATIVPLNPTNPAVPGGTLPIYNRSANSVYGYAQDFATPYTQNFNLSVTTTLRKNLTLDVRYVGTQGKKQQNDINVNLNNIYFNQELYDALDSARRGGNPLLLTQMLAGLNLGTGVIGTATNGAAALRASAVFNQNLLNGNYLGVANSLLTGTSTTWSGFASTAALGVTPSGRLLRNGCDRIATSGQTTFNGIALRCFPENYLSPNPQLPVSGISGAFYRTNSGSSNYHSMQTQITMRPSHGFSVQSTYTWSKNMMLYGSDNSNPLDRKADYSRHYSSISQDMRTNGTIELPFGPNKFLFGNSSGVLARIIEGWQMSAILNLSSGRPVSISALTGLNYAANGTTSPNVTPDVMGPFPARKADLVWNGALNRGSLFGETNPFVVVRDPQCDAASGFPTTLTCGLNAVARVVPAGTPGAITLPDGRLGQIVLQNPKPGTQGTLGQTRFEMPGTIRFDANLGKSFRLTESKSLQVRFDAANVLNHPNPNPAAPTISINSPDFGYLTNAKTGNRTFQGQLRLTF